MRESSQNTRENWIIKEKVEEGRQSLSFSSCPVELNGRLVPAGRLWGITTGAAVITVPTAVV